MAIREGYYVMLHKANEALALAGFKPGTHECTLLGIRGGVFNASELANDLRKAFKERINIDYYINPEKPELEEYRSPEAFIEKTVKPFTERIDEIIQNQTP
ncbi:MAG: hypothetical protein MAG715_00191 [Methanonatronarchaeales archaeon]|nr:hypothetical protein [Methanonatronarchaeales archaeon]